MGTYRKTNILKSEQGERGKGGARQRRSNIFLILKCKTEIEGIKKLLYFNDISSLQDNILSGNEPKSHCFADLCWWCSILADKKMSANLSNQFTRTIYFNLWNLLFKSILGSLLAFRWHVLLFTQKSCVTSIGSD